MSGTILETTRRNERVTSDLDIYRAAQATIARYGDRVPYTRPTAPTRCWPLVTWKGGPFGTGSSAQSMNFGDRHQATTKRCIDNSKRHAVVAVS